MALTISTQLTTVDGFVMTESYGRVAVANDYDGKLVQAALAVFPDQATFDAGAQPVKLNLQLNDIKQYDYDTDEKDILDLAHDIMIAKLAEQGVTATKNL